MTGKRQIAEPIEQEVFADLMSPNRVVLAKERRKKLTNKNDLNKKQVCLDQFVLGEC